jgi:NAD(P)H-dependent FMN reductase
MNITLICGSHRQNSQSSKVTRYLAGVVQKLGATPDSIDLAGNPLPLWDGLHTKPESASGKAWQPMAEKLKKADALVIVSPEWHGMVPAGLKNFFLFWSAAEVGHKPALIVTVSASRGGSYPVNELRTSGYKNSRVLYLPEHVIIQNVNNVLNGETEADKDDSYIRHRIDFALSVLLGYTKALKPLRETGTLTSPDYPNGM